MKRAVLAAVIALIAITSACTSEQRPEGVTERWLLSLNQGAAGRPDRYAPDDVSQQVVPGWQDLDPGHFDRIEVEHRIFPKGDVRPDATALVPFRLVTTDGVQTDGVASLEMDGGIWRITNATTGGAPAALSAPFGAGLRGWPIALVVGAVLALAALGLLTIVQRRASAA